jgi:flagellar brake protein
METLPMPLAAMGAGSTELDEFRLTAPREIAAMLRRLTDGSVPLHLAGSDGSALTATLWALDAERGSIGFNVDPTEPSLHALLECRDVLAVGYLDNVKLQFDLADVVLVKGERASVLRCAWPREMFRFQRRGAFRVRPLLRHAPVAHVARPVGPDHADQPLALRVLDVSIGGCALFLPHGVTAMPPGSLMNHTLIELDSDTRFHVDLRLQHVSQLNPDARGVRLGCEFVRADAAAQRALQRFIDATQKRSKLFALG